MKLLLITILMGGIIPVISANNNQYRFRTLSPEGGFSYDGVISVQQDHDGFIWILMENNLYRFDGYQYKHYYSRFTSLDNTVEWLFYGMEVCSSGKLFVSANNGLYAYNKTFDTFNLICPQNIEAFTVTNNDTIWIRQNKEWNIVDIEKKSLYTPLYDGEKPHFTGSVSCLNDEDFYVFGNYGKLYKYDNSKREFSFCMNLPHSDMPVLKAKSHKGKLWALVDKHGIYKINLSTFTIEAHFDFYNELGNNLTVRSFHVDKKGEIWLGTIHGLYILNPENGSYTHYKHSESDLFGLPNNSVWSINEDYQKNIWVGLFSGNICYVNLDEKNPFKAYYTHKNRDNHTPVTAFTEDPRHLWIGTDGWGISLIDKKTGDHTYYTYLEKGNGLSSDHIKSLVTDKAQNVWIGTYMGGLNCFNSKSKQFGHFVSDTEKNSLLNNNIRKIILENDSGLWIAYQQKRPAISFYSFKNKIFTHYDFSNGLSDINVFDNHCNYSKNSNNVYIFDLLRGRENQLWILSRKNLYRMDIRKNTVKKIETNDTVFANFSTFCFDDSGNLWIGTMGNGLIKYNPDTGNFSEYKDPMNLGASSIYSICNDDEGNIWMGTNTGLIRYNIKQDLFSDYDKQDGIQGAVHNPIASMKGADGNLYFGGTNGFTVVFPKEIVPNSYRPRVILSDFLINHVPTKALFSGKDPSNSEKEIVLNYNQTNFGLKFASDNYLIPEKNRFRYRLKGYDARWIETDASNRTALYSKVPPGVYYFEIKASNNDNVWSDETTVVKIIRKPTPWLWWPAYCLYSLFGLFVLYLILRYYNGKKKLKFQLYLETIEKTKKEEIHQTQLRFYTDISHDFKTPLSLILAALYNMKKNGQKKNYHDIVENNTRRLLKLVNELMDFKTIENGGKSLELQMVNVNTFVENIAMDFKEYANEEGIHFRIKTSLALKLVCIDKNVLEKIIMNLLNNAFKHTNNGDSVSVEILSENDLFQSEYAVHHAISSENFVPGNTFGIVIRDTGTGIPKESIEDVFERYFKLNTTGSDSHPGTGIGLALVKSLILLHKGELNIFSEEKKGTDIEIRFSMDEKTYDASSSTARSEQYLHEKSKLKKLNPSSDENNVDRLMKSGKKRILLVEDHDDLRELITDTLSEEYDIVQAEDGIVALEILKDRIVNLVICDIMMPNMDGITLSEKIKNNIKTSHVPIVLLTARSGIESKIEGAGSGADIYLEKPIDFNLLRLTVRNVFKQQQQLKEYYAKNHFADNPDLSSNEEDNKFLRDFIQIIDNNLNQSDLDVNYIASQMSMSRSKLYNKVKMMTGQSIIEFVLNIRFAKAARLIIEENMSMRQVMEMIGIESQSYFTNTFKKKFGETPTTFASNHRKQKPDKT
ncbi:MAG: response regulator [Dysgonamonadaceae bacterium]|jgi:signal transduction histidine kinase/DNA-binding response OmpR family regulator/ligand-binding sensor domain-containing protein|nr:response regulator [Dysgonamonadaceae bacterium]